MRPLENHIMSKNMRGDIPCGKCGIDENPIWWTDNVFWNSVIRGADRRGSEIPGEILCPLCFMEIAEEKYDVKSWRIIPEFRWNEKNG